MKHANILYSIEKVVMDICTKIMAMQLYPSQISLYINRYIDIPIYVQMIDIQIYRQIPGHKDRYIDKYIYQKYIRNKDVWQIPLYCYLDRKKGKWRD